MVGETKGLHAWKKLDMIKYSLPAAPPCLYYVWVDDVEGLTSNCHNISMNNQVIRHTYTRCL